MIGHRLKYLCSIAKAKTTANPVQTRTLQVEQQANPVRRLEVAIFAQYSFPRLIATIDALPLLKDISNYNPALTNGFTKGGSQLQQFPLVKLLHIGLKMVEKQEADLQFWRKFENLVKVRLHRCTVQQNMRLLFIMLKVWPIYRFNPPFISSICLGLKKELDIMNDDQLRALMRVTAAGIQSLTAYENGVLLSLQTALLNRVLALWQNFQPSKKNISLQGLYSWLGFGTVLSLRNKPQYLIIQEKVVRLANLFNKVYLKTTLSGLLLKQPSEESLLIMLQVLAAYEPIYRYYGKAGSDGGQPSWAEVFEKLKLALISHSISTISRLMQKQTAKGKIQQLNCILTLIPKNTLENMLTQEEQPSKQTSSYPHLTKLIEQALDDRNEVELVPRLKLLLILLEQQIVDWNLAKLYYQSVYLDATVESSLALTSHLLQLELYFYLLSDKFQTRAQSHRLITDFLKKNQCNYRNLDWLAFHYLRLTITRQMKMPLLSHQNMLVQTANYSNNSLQHTLINRILLEAKATDSKSLLEQEKILLQRSHRQIDSLKKFFIEVRLHQLQTLQPIIPPFSRLPHFSNQNLKIAVHAYSEAQITSLAVLLQKRLLNQIGWKVVNVKMPYFVNLTTGERVSRISKAIEQQQLLIATKQLLQ